MSICKYCDQEGIEIRQSKKTGKYYAVNSDGSFHQCPNYNKIKNNDESSKTEINLQPIPEITNAGELFDNKSIDNARWFIDGLNLRLVKKRIELVVKEKGVA